MGAFQPGWLAVLPQPTMPSTRSTGLGAVAAVLAVAAMLAMSDVASPAHPGANGRIAFASESDGDFELYTVLPSGKGLRKVTNNRVDDGCPSWSPDGRWIAFTRTRPGHGRDVFVMRSDGSGVRRVTQSPGEDSCPSWSRDGARIAFTRVYLPLNAPSRKIDGDIFTVGRDGKGLRRVTHRQPGFESSEWGPSGLFVLNLHKLDLDVWVFDGSGNGRDQHAPGAARYPTWSPDGRRIAFESDFQGQDDLYTVGVGGDDVRRVTATARSESWPAWSPDGRKLVYSAMGGLWTSNADGTAARLTVRMRGTTIQADWGRSP